MDADPRGMEEIDLAVTGMSCAACTGRVERALRRVPGVIEAEVNAATERARIRVVSGGAGADALIAAVTAAGYGADLPRADRENAGMAPALPLLALAGALALPLVAPMLLLPFGVELMLPPLTQLVLASIVQFVCGARFYRAGFSALLAGTGNMDLLVALGTSAAYGMSVWQVLAGHDGHHLYFEASAVVIALV